MVERRTRGGITENRTYSRISLCASSHVTYCAIARSVLAKQISSRVTACMQFGPMQFSQAEHKAKGIVARFAE